MFDADIVLVVSTMLVRIVVEGQEGGDDLAEKKGGLPWSEGVAAVVIKEEVGEGTCGGVDDEEGGAVCGVVPGVDGDDVEVRGKLGVVG